jgi:hypothetical protein
LAGGDIYMIDGSHYVQEKVVGLKRKAQGNDFENKFAKVNSGLPCVFPVQTDDKNTIKDRVYATDILSTLALGPASVTAEQTQ